MPDVAGKKLDVAPSEIESAGFQDDVDVVGGGLFGIVNESTGRSASRHRHQESRTPRPRGWWSSATATRTTRTRPGGLKGA